ncbi:MAG: YihY/virulence factor BrkB family protein [Bacilli bacterium]
MEKIKKFFQDIKRLLIKLIQIVSRQEMRILPGQIAFFLILSIFPIITILGMFMSLFMISFDAILEFASQILPIQVVNILEPYINGQITTNVVLTLMIGFFLASNGPHSIIVAADTLYNIKGKDYLQTRLKAIFMTIILMIVFVIMVVGLAFGNTIIKSLLAVGLFEDIGPQIYNIYLLFKWPTAFLLIFLCIKLLYTMAPDKQLPSSHVNKGAGFTTICWTIVTLIYSFYINNFSHYDLFYGSLANIIILMMWVYIISYILVIGIAINSGVYEKEKITSNKK